jgi:type II secretion system protein H
MWAIGDMELRVPERRSRSPRRGLRGFSLLELMVVVILIAIMSALILPQMRGTFEGAILKTTGRKLIAAMNLAHSRAVTLQQLHRVVFDAKDGRFVVERNARDTEGSSYTALADVPGGAGELDKRLTIDVHKEGEAESSTISFYPNGTADTAEILLRDREGFQLGLRINPITARVSVQELGRDAPK